MKLNSDWHIHSQNSCDGACMTLDDLVAEAEQIGIRKLGITDHIHSAYNLPDLAAARREYEATATNLEFHFGVEVSCMSQWELAEIAAGKRHEPVYGVRNGGPAGAALALGFSEADRQSNQVEFVVGGTHWPMYVAFTRDAIIRDYHRQNMFLATHDLVDIVAHPWWWMGHWKNKQGQYLKEPWFDDFTAIPDSMHREFAMAIVENGKFAEINLSAMLLTKNYNDHFKQQYLEYLNFLKSLGVRFTIGSDCHLRHYTQIDFEKAATMLKEAGFREDDFCCPV